MPGLKSIVLAAGLMLAGTGVSAQTAGEVPQPAAAQPAAAAPAAGTADPAAAVPTGAAPAAEATPADPTLNADGTPILTPTAGIGQPVDGRLGVQPQVTATGEQAAWFHNVILVPLITIISIFVLVLLVWTIVRYRRAANPVPSKTSHNTFIEVVWTLAPVLILVAIAVPSIGLLARQYKPAPDNAVTLKAIGNQWYWSYEYPDHGGVALTANMLREPSEVQPGQRARTDADGPRLLAVDNRVVLPVGVPIRLITTGNDVIHSWAMPAFWIKLDAVPGRLNETSFTIDKPGLYFGQCSELCGARHAYMPIAVEAVSPAVFAQWIRAKGGTMPGEEAPAAAPAAAGTPADDTATPANAAVPASDDALVNGAATSPVSNQAATGNAGALGNADQ
ncbi:cytochrome c oxidase subunit II [Sphingomonas japonica]|uniref:Cytochrome c oxidase subunit 2 n=1 Tax=Sphingomonas japonica TaxID=511662 RepID=A0ABX0U349_9SPHN|nr:cytochrome c oxidase subunit II [Sphingomonas japonica]NIJ23782.1 cytochrome c oxidase subunit 2 [Sphingomonas japonica]